MKYRYLLTLLLSFFLISDSHAQKVLDNAFLQGKYLEACVAPNGAWGSTVTVSATYHTRPGSFPSYADPALMLTMPVPGNQLDFSYDAGHDGWTVGTDPFYGPYFLPGTPFDGWYMQVDGVMSSAFYTNGAYSYTPGSGFNNSLGGGTLAGTVTGYSNTGGNKIGTWTGSAGLGSKLQITADNQLDTLADWLVVTVKFKNTSSAIMKDIYYEATADPDNDEVLSSGSFPTNNHISYQNDIEHRVEVNARPPSLRQNCFSGLAAKDCRARALIYQSWPPAMSDDTKLDSVWIKTGGGVYGSGGALGNKDTTIGFGGYYSVDQTTTSSQDIAYGILFHVGDIAPNDSAIISFAWIFSDTLAVDSAFPKPLMVINNKFSKFTDTVVGCSVVSGVQHVDISGGDQRNWSLTDWTWAPSAGLSTTRGTAVDISIKQVQGPTTYTITGTNPYTCAQQQFLLYVTPCFSATSTNPCEGDTLFLAAHGDSLGATYKWFGPSGYTNTGQFIYRHPSSVADTGMYMVVRTVGAISDTAMVDGTVRLLAQVSAKSNTPCSQSSLNLTSSTVYPADSFEWQGPKGFTSTLQNPAIGSVPVGDTGTYMVIAALNGCFDTAYVYSHIDSTPVVPTAYSNSSGLLGAAICEGDTLILSATDVSTGVMFTWQGPAAFTGTGAIQVIAPSSTASSGVYTVTATLGAGCLATATTKVVINPTPPLAATSNSPVCSGGLNQLRLQALSLPGATFEWTGPHTFSSTDQNPVRMPVLMDYGGIYTVTAHLNGCSATRLDTVVINETPLAPWTKWLTFCQFYKPDPLQAMGENILWYTENTDTLIGSKTAPIPNTDVVGETFFYATQSVKGCISALDSMKITVYPKPTVKVTPTVVAVCPHESAVLKAIDTDPLTYYHWYPSTYMSDTASDSVTIHPETNSHYKVVATNMFGCSDTGFVSVTVHAGATLRIEDSTTIYPGEKYQLNPQSNCSSFSWFPSTGLSDPNISNPIAAPLVSTRYKVTGTNESGCVVVDSIDIYVTKESLLAMPNAFAPGNGPNNKFKVIVKGIATLKSFSIYDRWGVRVFETADINEGWDGKFKGVPQPFGVYIYNIEAETSAGEPFMKTGNVTLLR